MALRSLVEKLREDGYQEAAVRQLLGVPDLVRQPLYAAVENSPAAHWANFWLLQQPQKRSGLWVEALLELGLLHQVGDLVQALCTLTPVEDLFLLAEGDLQPDSRLFALARLTPRGRRDALHLGCGAGLMPLLFGGDCHDQNPRALAFAELNARLNDRPFQTGRQQTYPLVTASLPFPHPERGQIPQNPQLEAYLEHVQPGGCLAIACSYATPLGFTENLVEQLDYARSSVIDYAASLVDRPQLIRAFGPVDGEQAYRLEVVERLKTLESAGITHIHDAVILLTRSARAHYLRRAVDYPLPDPTPRESWPESPPATQARSFRGSGYSEDNLRELLDLPEVLYTPEQHPALVHRLARQDSELARLAAYWLLQQPQAGKRARAMLFPCLGHHFFTDPMFDHRPDQVYWLGPDSLALARTVPRTPRPRSLDLCTGSGVQAVLNASHCQENWAVDINPRAVHFARRNARFNGVDLKVLQGNLYEPIPTGRFDLITANPPFVPTPETGLQWFRPGGQSGEEISAEIIRQLPQRLEIGGTLVLVSQCPILSHSQPLDRVQSWLGQTHGWGLVQLRFGKLERAGLIASHTQTAEEFELWNQSYQRLGIQGAHLAVTLVRRLQPDQPGYRKTVDLQMPRQQISSQVEALLARLDQA